MSFFPHKYIVTYGHSKDAFSPDKVEQMTVKAFDSQEAEDTVREAIHDRYPFYCIMSVVRKGKKK